MRDRSFQVESEELLMALRELDPQGKSGNMPDRKIIPFSLPSKGIGEQEVMNLLAPLVLGGARYLDDPLSFAHMDPPTPWITWATTFWNARLNQNLLHPATAPVARSLEQQLVQWLAPYFGMDGGHMVPGSTLANLTAIWAARELIGVEEVVAADTAHLSIEKAAHILGLRFRKLPTDHLGRLLPIVTSKFERTCLVLVAGSTPTGLVDPLHLAGKAAWTHVDAAWAGPLRISRAYSSLLDGIEQADSISISAHKLLFQPKESALVFFRDTARAHSALSFGGSYLSVPNVGILGSHGATAIPLLATLWAWGQEGLERRLDRCMQYAEQFAAFILQDPRLELLCPPETGVVVWRHRKKSVPEMAATLPDGLASQTMVEGERWLRCVAANPVADVDGIIAAVLEACENK